MKKVFFFFLLFFILLAFGLIVYQFFWKKNERGALQITASPQGKVYIDSIYKGTTPLCFCPKNGEIDEKNIQDMLPVGEHAVRIVPEKSSYPEFQETIKIEKSVLAVIDRKFSEGASSEGFVISLSRLNGSSSNELSVVSIPDRAEVLLDNAKKGETPLQLSSLTVSDHTLTLQKPGYRSKTIRIKVTSGYKLMTKGYLGVDLSMLEREKNIASSSGTPTPAISVIKVLILQTGTGFLRVRDSNSLGGKEIAQVLPGEEFTLLDEQTGWYQIELPDGKAGWVSSQYVEKVTK